MTKDTITVNGVLYKRVEEEPKPWPQDCDNYYYISTVGGVDIGLYLEDDSIEDGKIVWLKRIGNLFKTRREAENHLRFLKIQERIRQLAGDQSWIDWDVDEQGKWYLHYFDSKPFCTTVYEPIASIFSYFEEDPAEFLLKAIGEEDLKFYCEYKR